MRALPYSQIYISFDIIWAAPVDQYFPRAHQVQKYFDTFKPILEKKRTYYILGWENEFQMQDYGSKYFFQKYYRIFVDQKFTVSHVCLQA